MNTPTPKTEIKPTVSNVAKRMLASTLKSVLSHNDKNLKELAIKKNPIKRTYAEKTALSSSF